jgi:hypothetical protein
VAVTLYTVNGTAAAGPADPGQYPVQVAEALTNPWQQIMDNLEGIEYVPQWNWVPIDYPAAVYPMGKSVDVGVANLVSAIKATPVGPKKAFAGYSQGAIVTSTVWRDYILSGSLHEYLPDFVAAVNWGNPMRCPTIPANGNFYAGWAPQKGGGISGTNDLTAAQTPAWWYDFANANDLYTDSPVGTAAGSDEELIYNMIVSESFGGTLVGLIKLIESAVVQFLNPISEVIGIATAIWNGLRFLVAGPNAGHFQYDITPAIKYLQEIGQQFA